MPTFDCAKLDSRLEADCEFLLNLTLTSSKNDARLHMMVERSDLNSAQVCSDAQNSKTVMGEQDMRIGGDKTANHKQCSEGFSTSLAAACTSNTHGTEHFRVRKFCTKKMKTC